MCQATYCISIAMQITLETINITTVITKLPLFIFIVQWFYITL